MNPTASASLARAGRTPVHWHETGDGPPLLLLNGWTVSGLVWPGGWVRQLEASFRVIRVDNRGTGWSRHADVPFTIADLADDAASVLRRSGVANAVVVGLSMGGMIAQELALRHPALVDRLVLVATRPPAPAQIMGETHVLGAAFGRPAPGEPLAEHLSRVWSAFPASGWAEEHPAEFSQLIASIVRRPTPRFAVNQQMRAMTGWRGPERLRKICAPTLVVHGDRDRLLPVGNGMRLAQLVPTAEYHELAGVGHLVPHEAPEQLLALLSH